MNKSRSFVEYFQWIHKILIHKIGLTDLFMIDPFLEFNSLSHWTDRSGKQPTKEDFPWIMVYILVIFSD